MLRLPLPSVPDLPHLDLRTRPAWRRWLRENHADSQGVWLVFHKAHTNVDSIPYDDSVREALCFGWVDSLIRRLDDDRYVRKFTPRRGGSKWSDSNRKRWAELKEAGQLAPAGLAAAPTDNKTGALADIPDLPDYIAAAFQADPKAWAFFQSLAPGYRRRFVGWIHIAKREETRQKRIREAVATLRAGKKLGPK